MTTYYKNDVTKVTSAELRRLAPSRLLSAIIRLRKFLHWPSTPVLGVKRSERLDTLEFDELPRPARQQLRDSIEDWEDLGFRFAFCYAIESIGPVEAYAASL